MAAKIKWHGYGTKLRHCHPVITDFKNPDKMKILTPFFGVILEMFPDGCARRTQRFS